MDKFRRDIHGVFSRQQSGLGSTAGASDRLLRQALAPAMVRRHLVPQLAAALATLLVGAAIAYTVIVTRGHLHSQNPVTRVTPSATPKASATPVAAPTALAQPLDVPSTTPVILYSDPIDHTQMDGVTWDGTQRGRVGTSDPTAGSANPAGTYYASASDIRDRSGRVVAALGGSQKSFGGTWADTGAQYCQLTATSPVSPNGAPTTLQLVQVGGASRNIARVGTAGEQTWIKAISCSVERDRAIVVQSGGQGIGTYQLWAVQLSTGRIIWTRSYQTSIVDIRASRDGLLVAEMNTDGSGSTTIYGSTGAVVGRVSGPVQGFSWDGSLAVVGSHGGTSSLVRWRDSTVVWTAPAGTMFWTMWPEAGGPRVAVAVQTPAHPQADALVDVYAVSPDGTASKILSDVNVPV
ncbi:MAG: hypothetical protein M3077_10255 [Candidatus Dormibacteraeota bacterium]|nr:hypothetical protein [Candidatus Dormibacteraeota bacterium]